MFKTRNYWIGSTGTRVRKPGKWKYSPLRNGLTDLKKRMVIAQVAQKEVLAIFKTHTYTFAKKFFLQKMGAPIGLTFVMGRMVSYRIRIADTAEVAMSRLLPSTNPSGPRDCGRSNCVVCEQNERKNILYGKRCQVGQVKNS